MSNQSPDSSDKRIKKLEEEYLNRGDDDRSMQQLATAGLELGLSVIVLVGLGWWADSRFGSSPWLLLVGAFLGIAGGMIRLVYRYKRISGS
jgi:F0F1-type ATP synthase assembly protein I